MDNGTTVIVCMSIICVTIVLFRAISLPVAMQRLDNKLEKVLARLELKGDRVEERHDTKEGRIENRT